RSSGENDPATPIVRDLSHSRGLAYLGIDELGATTGTRSRGTAETEPPRLPARARTTPYRRCAPRARGIGAPCPKWPPAKAFQPQSGTGASPPDPCGTARTR